MSLKSNTITADLYNSYMEELDSLLRELRDCELQLMKDMFRFKRTERDEIKIALFEIKRKALICVKFEEDEFNLDMQSTLCEKESSDEKTGVTEIDEDKIEVIDPIKLVHGGFTSLRVKDTQRDYMNLVIHIIKVVNLKRQIEQELNGIKG